MRKRSIRESFCLTRMILLGIITEIREKRGREEVAYSGTNREEPVAERDRLYCVGIHLGVVH